MKLWILRPCRSADQRWGFDCTYGLVILADSEQEARTIASKESCGMEGEAVWLNPKDTSCEELTPDYAEEAGVIMTDYNAG